VIGVTVEEVVVNPAAESPAAIDPVYVLSPEYEAVTTSEAFDFEDDEFELVEVVVLLPVLAVLVAVDPLLQPPRLAISVTAINATNKLGSLRRRGTIKSSRPAASTTGAAPIPVFAPGERPAGSCGSFIAARFAQLVV